MRKTDVEKYRQRLLTMGKRIQMSFSYVSQEALRQSGGDTAGNISRAPLHPADLSNDTFEHEVALGLLENEDRLLEQIVTALRRIDEGTYGECMECGTKIPTERLELLPYTAHCVSCAGKLEAQSQE